MHPPSPHKPKLSQVDVGPSAVDAVPVRLAMWIRQLQASVICATDRATASGIVISCRFRSPGLPKAQVVADRTVGMTQQDKNADGLLCVAELWGTELNPNSHWAQFWGDLLNPPEAQVFVVFDNHMGTSNNS